MRDDSHILVRKWTYETQVTPEFEGRGDEYSNPVIYENTLIFGNRSRGITSLYPSLNQKRWEFSIPGGVTSEIFVERGNAYFGGGDGFIYSVNADSGQMNWKYEVKNPMVSKPTVSGGRLFVNTSNDMVYCLDAGTGKWIWHYRRRSSSNTTIHGASSPLVDGNTVLAGLSDGFLVALSLDEGQLKWEKRLHHGSKFTDVDAHPVLENGIIYLPSYDGSLYALKRKPDGVDVLWKFDAGGSKDVVLDDQRIFFPSSDGTIYALQKSNGKQLWKFDLDKGTPTQLILTDRYLIFGSSYQYLYVLDKNSGENTGNGKGLYRFNVGYDSGFSGSPAYDSNLQRIYILSGAGNLYAFAIRPPVKRFRPHGRQDAYDFTVQ